MAGYIYLVHIPEYAIDGIPIYKLGRTMQENLGRFVDYPKDSKLLLHKEVNDHVRIEAELIVKFNEQFTLVAGREWFLGDRNQMIDTIDEHIKQTRTRDLSVCEVKESKRPTKKIRAIAPKAPELPRSGHFWVKMDRRMEDTIDNITMRFRGIGLDDNVLEL